MSPEIVVALLLETADLVEAGSLPRDVHAEAAREAARLLAVEFGG